MTSVCGFKMIVFWDVSPRSVAKTERRFRGDDGEAASTSEMSINFY
jgi:hypothetical protein